MVIFKVHGDKHEKIHCNLHPDPARADIPDSGQADGGSARSGLVEREMGAEKSGLDEL